MPVKISACSLYSSPHNLTQQQGGDTEIDIEQVQKCLFYLSSVCGGILESG